MYSEFQEITLPALRFEKVEETDTKKWKKWKRYTEEKRRSTTLDEAKKPKEKTTLNDAQRKAESLARKTTRKEVSKPQASIIREIKLTHRKNGH